MKGQTSLEFMVVLAVFIAVLVFWLGGVNTANKNISEALGIQQARLATDKLSAAVNSVCVMGKGNSLDVNVAVQGNASVRYTNKLILEWNNHSFEKSVYCAFNNFELHGKDYVNITNNKTIVVMHTT